MSRGTAGKEEGQYGTEAGNFVRNLMNIVPHYFPFRDVLDKIFIRHRTDMSRGNKRYRGIQPRTFVPRIRTEEFKVFAGVTSTMIGKKSTIPDLPDVRY